MFILSYFLFLLLSSTFSLLSVSPSSSFPFSFFSFFSLEVD